MKSLKNIRLVQFYLFEKEDLPISQVCGIFGPNGSGKSAFIDALQIVMTGAHQHYMAFNAQADETQSTTRSIRSYCLGQTGEAESGRARQSATTYITLVWEDDATGEPTSMGVCIKASADSEKHEVQGRYILPGVALTLDDHLEQMGNTQRSLEWKVFRKGLEGRAQRAGFEGEVIFSEPLRFVRAYLTALRGSGAIPHAESFLRAFRFGLKMRFDKPIDEIVRHQVLEQRDTNVRKFKEVMESFRSLRNRVVEIEAKIQEVEVVATLYNDAARLSSQVLTWEALAAKGKMLDAESRLSERGLKAQAAQEALAAALIAQTTHEGAISDAEVQVSHFNRLVLDHGSYADTRDRQALIETLQGNLQREQEASARNLASLLQALQLVADNPPLNPQEVDVYPLVDQLNALLTSDSLPNLSALSAILDPALRVVGEAFKVATSNRVKIETKVKELKLERDQVNANLQRVQGGKPPLLPKVLQLKDVLSDNGISCTPVCDLVSVTDPSWQPVIEAFLGPHLQALLVEDREEKAFSLYRQQQGLYGVKLVRESRHRKHDNPGQGSVAELLQGSHPAAVAYLRSQFSRTMRADSDQEALAEERTLTRDGMLTGNTVDRLRPMSATEFLLGADNRSAQYEELKKALRFLETSIDDCSRRIETWGKISDKLSPLSSAEHFREQALRILQQLANTSEELDVTERKFKDDANPEYLRLCEKQSEWQGQLKSLRGQSKNINEVAGGARENASQQESLLKQARDQFEMVQQRFDGLRLKRSFDADFAQTQWGEMIEIKRLSNLAAADAADGELRKASKSQNEKLTDAARKLESFRIRYSESPPEDVGDWTKTHVWIIKHLDLLRSAELEQYREQMDDAFKASQDIFRNDVALAINGNLEWLRSFQDRLNAVLENAPAFSNGEHYRFVRTERKEHAALLKFIRDVKQWGTQTDLVNAGDMPEAFKALLDENASGLPSSRGPLDDYREFFDFDIEIYRKADSKKVTLGRLSRRIGTGSGGEHKAPLYVIAGAALASAYHLSPAHRDGLALIVLDEAFNKMDPNNITATMQYMDDLGLQVMMASPGENLGTLTAFLHSYYDIIRDAQTNVVKLSHRQVSEGTRELFRADLLEFNPELLERELNAMKVSRSGQSEGIS